MRLHRIASLIVFLVCGSAMAQKSSSKQSSGKKAEVSSATPAAAAKAPEKAPEKANEKTPEKPPENPNSAMNSDFDKSLYFETSGGLMVPPPEFEYDLASDKTTLKMGTVSLNQKSFLFALKPLGEFDPQLVPILKKNEASQNVFILSWPTELLDIGTVELISRDGKVLWKYVITEKLKKEWSSQLDGWQAQLKEKNKNAEPVSTGIFAVPYAFMDINQVPLKQLSEPFRFCIAKVEGKTQTRLCSQRYSVKLNGKEVSMGRMDSSTTARVLIQNETAPLKNNVVTTLEMPFSFYADLSTGESYEFVANPPKMNLMDFSETEKPDLFKLVGFNYPPFAKHVLLNPDQYSKFTKMLGFEATIGDPRRFWSVEISRQTPHLYFPGTGGGVFKQRFQVNDLPRNKARVYLHKNTPVGTYSSSPDLLVRKLPAMDVKSSQVVVKPTKKDPNVLEWTFAAPLKNEVNRSFLEVTSEGKTYKSYYELFRAFANELSVRSSGVVSTSGNVIVAEIAYNHWFESVFGWRNKWASMQRWGFSYKYFKSLNQLTVNDSGTKADLSVTTADIKYRLTPGLWTRDESTGLMLSYQDVAFGTVKTNMAGGGWFWARSMPRVFDELFNYFKFMRYPKWVDMEIIYFTSPLKKSVTLNNTLAVNFHGQVLWGKYVFGEAGFGLKRYAFTDSTLNQRAELNSFYGTVGLGVKF